MSKLRKPKVKHIPDALVEVSNPPHDDRKNKRSVKYDPAICPQVEEWGTQGWSFVQIAVELQVTRQTLHNWAARYPEFFDSLTRARESALAYWERMGEMGLTAERFNATIWTRIITSRWPKEYGKNAASEFAHVSDEEKGNQTKTLDLSVVEPEHRDIVLRALVAMKEAAERQEDE